MLAGPALTIQVTLALPVRHTCTLPIIIYLRILDPVPDDDFCDRNLIGRHGDGVIHSPNYPFNYKNNRECRYRIYLGQNPPGNKRTICFRFLRFQLEESGSCVNDYLEFPQDSGILNKYCGRGTWNRGEEVNIMSNVFSPEFCCKCIYLLIY